MEIGQYLTKARKQKGLSQEAVANELNVSRQSVSLWECDQTIPSLDNLFSLSNLYGVSISVLTGQEEFKDIPPCPQIIINDTEKLMRESSYKKNLILSIVFLSLTALLVLVPVISIILALLAILFSILSITRIKTNYNLFTLIFAVSLLFVAIFANINMDLISNLIMGVNI